MISTTTYQQSSPRSANGGYRYFFNGQESDGEVYGEGGLTGYEFRQYDTRLGRWWGVDLKSAKYPSFSPYQFCASNPTISKDVDGGDFVVVIDNSGPYKTISIQMNIYSNSTDAYRQLLPAVNEFNQIIKTVTIDDVEYHVFFELRAVQPDETAQHDYIKGRPLEDVVSHNAYIGASEDGLWGNLFYGTMPGQNQEKTSTNDCLRYVGGYTRGRSIRMFHGPNGEDFGNYPQLIAHEILHHLGLSDEGGQFYTPGGRMEYIATQNNNYKMYPISNGDLINILKFAFLFDSWKSNSTEVRIDYTEDSEHIIPNPTINIYE